VKQQPSSVRPQLFLLLSLALVLASQAFSKDKSPAPATKSDMEFETLQVSPSSFLESDPSSITGAGKPLPGVVPIHSSSSQQYNVTRPLEDAGVKFPPGSFAIYDRAFSCLIVRNTKANIDLIDAGFGGGSEFSISAMEIEISAYECAMPGSANAMTLPKPTFSDLQKLPAGSIKLLDSISFIAHTGQRSIASHITSNTDTPAGNPPQTAITAAPANSTTPFSAGAVGSKLEIEPLEEPDCSSENRLIYHLRINPESSKEITTIDLQTEFAAWDDYPVTINFSPIQNQEGKFIAVVARIRLVNPGGWKLPKIDSATSPLKANKIPRLQ
jgi:hypothetical protein